jgi:hypothetical protein
VTPVSEQPTDPSVTPDAPPAPVTTAREVPAPPVTGDPVLDEATSRIADAAGLPLEAQVEAYEHAHRALESRLADVEG